VNWAYASALPGVAWPALPASAGASVLALLFQLERTQWLAADRLEQLQRQQLARLMEHAWRTVPFYRQRWARRPVAADLERLPPLERRDLQENFEALKSVELPAEHGGAGETRTSGATGMPVRLLRSGVSNLMWRALTLREHRWHRRDLGAKLAVIRQGSAAGEARSWGPATDGVAATGPLVALPIGTDVDAQLDWLASQGPAYLYTYPSNVGALARASLGRGIRLHGLREVRTLGEQLDPELRELCREAWGVPVVDTYSAQEVGYIALQCPSAEHYHLQAESLVVEVLNDAGRPCVAGEVGRVVVTDLHNFATPLVRYVLGDYAAVGEACRCGRGLATLQRVFGRARNMLLTRDGKRYWPAFGSRALPTLAAIVQHQFVQKEHDLVEARLVTAAPLSGAQEAAVRAHVLSRLPAGFRLDLVRRDRIERTAGGKFEEFVCEVPPSGAGP
jgi:phenylacetate-CoA ligase